MAVRRAGGVVILRSSSAFGQVVRSLPRADDHPARRGYRDTEIMRWLFTPPIRR